MGPPKINSLFVSNSYFAQYLWGDIGHYAYQWKAKYVLYMNILKNQLILVFLVQFFSQYTYFSIEMEIFYYELYLNVF